MSKIRLLATIVALIAAMPAAVTAQTSRVVTLDEVFDLAEEHSKTLEVGRAALREAEAVVTEAKGGRLPEISLSASASYLGNGLLTDRNFSNAQNIEMPHFGNNFAVEASQLIYGGGAVNNVLGIREVAIRK